MEYWSEFLIVASVHLLAVASPGPDFALIMKNSLTASRKVAIWSAGGVALGIMVHVLFALVGLSFLIATSAFAFTVVKYAGAAYLIYIGYKSLKAKPCAVLSTEIERVVSHMSVGEALRVGFLTNVLNPKAALFFLGLFTQVISPNTPLWLKSAYGIEMTIATFAWFTIIAVVLSHGSVRGLFVSSMHHVERFFGVVLIALGIKVALSEK